MFDSPFPFPSNFKPSGKLNPKTKFFEDFTKNGISRESLVKIFSFEEKFIDFLRKILLRKKDFKLFQIKSINFSSKLESHKDLHQRFSWYLICVRSSIMLSFNFYKSIFHFLLAIVTEPSFLQKILLFLLLQIKTFDLKYRIVEWNLIKVRKVTSKPCNRDCTVSVE